MPEAAPPATGPLFDLTGHVAVVTGGNCGIGLGMAEGLARSGADIAVWGTNEAKNAAAAERLAAHGVEAQAFRCDVGDEEQVDAAFAATLEAFGQGRQHVRQRRRRRPGPSRSSR